MKKYFIQNKDIQEGPFSLDDLKQKGLTYKTMVWFDGISAWTEAQFIPELKEIATSIPPPITKTQTISTDKSTESTKQTTKTDNKMKNKIIPIALTIICIILLILLLLPRHDSISSHRLDRNLFIGKWTGEYNLELKADSTFSFSCHGSSQNFFGKWARTDCYLNKDTMTFIVLKNLKEQQYSNEDWFRNYFLEIESVSNNTMIVIDLSASLTVRRNNSYKLKKE